MAEPIKANYVADGDNWTVTVTGRGEQLTAKAPGIIAVRDRADQLVQELAPGEESPRVVHLLNGNALEFTTAYLTARMAKAAAAVDGEGTAEQTPAKKVPSPRASQSVEQVAVSDADPNGEVAQTS